MELLQECHVTWKEGDAERWHQHYMEVARRWESLVRGIVFRRPVITLRIAPRAHCEVCGKVTKVRDLEECRRCCLKFGVGCCWGLWQPMTDFTCDACWNNHPVIRL